MGLMETVSQAVSYSSQLDWYLRQVITDGTVERASDRLGTDPLRKLALSETFLNVRFGVVKAAIGHTHWYAVQPDGLSATIRCTSLAHSSLSPMGARDFTSYQPGTTVIFVRQPGARWGYILGAVPWAARDPRLQLPDAVSQSSHGGVQVDGVHQFPFRLARQGGVVNFSCGRPTDSLPGAGEWGVQTHTGLQFFLDPDLQIVGRDGLGLTLFDEDELLRLAAVHQQIRLAAYCEDAFLDQGEWMRERGETPYPWEALGALRPGVTRHRDHSARETQTQDQVYSSCEPLHDDQQPFWRLTEYGGYLGGLYSRFVAAPPSGDVLRYQDEAILTGLFREHLDTDGSWSAFAARRVTIGRKNLIVVPKRIRPIESGQGDTTSNYRFAGHSGSGPSHAILPSDPERTPTGVEGMAAQLDDHARSEWGAYRSFAYHTRDFYLPEEADLGEDPPPDFSILQQEGYLPAPGVRRVSLDHRQDLLQIFGGRCDIDFMPDGNVLLTGGQGCQFAMINGQIFLDAPGGIYARAGTNFVALSGRDIILRAKGSLEGSSTDADIRLKAQRHFQMAAGVGGTGCLLLDGRGEDIEHDYTNKVGTDVQGGGVVVRSRGDLALLGVDTFLHAETSLAMDVPEGAVTTRARQCDRYMRLGGSDYFGLEDDYTAVNRYLPENTLLSGGLAVTGSTSIRGSLTTQRDIMVVQGHISTSGSEGASGLVDVLEGETLTQASDTVGAVMEEFVQISLEDGQTTFDELAERFLAAGRVGNTLFLGQVGMSFRTSEQARTLGLVLPEAYWQQLARLSGQGLTVWNESDVTAGGTSTAPFPGRETLDDTSSFRRGSPVLYDAARGTSLDYHDSAYASGRTATEDVALEGNYIVIG